MLLVNKDLHNGPLLCGFDIGVKGLNIHAARLHARVKYTRRSSARQQNYSGHCRHRRSKKRASPEQSRENEQLFEACRYAGSGDVY